jgi:hypothetical protein
MPNHFSRDPRWITAKFSSPCSRCKTTVKKGEQIFYYPASRSVLCHRDECGPKASRELDANVFDEANNVCM